MAQYLIDIYQTSIGGDTVQTVNARELHTFLEIGKDFSTWITDRINKYNLLENQDFVCFPILGSKGRGGHNRKDYHLTLSVAKELSMVENNKKGREARLYFIECERRLKQAATLQIETPQVDYSKPEALLGVLNHLQSQIEQKDNTIAELTPKAKALEGLKRSDGLFGLIEAAKMLEVRPKDLTDYLRRFAKFLFDNVLSVCLLSNQVPQKHLKTSSGLVAEIINLLNIKDFDSLYAVAYNGLVGCGYAIEYPYGESITTD
ncbi:antA/AntB antirepressor family protein [Bartonella henselae]|uniref:antA/AntB antirepressor family protein n=1 Tax=Bartonella henselae TaxID=38323 RepID=UPI000A86570E|nr:antA/AntB antirepressor family protein [Bartonella henselae]